MEGPLAKFLRNDAAPDRDEESSSSSKDVADPGVVGPNRRLPGTEQPSRLDPTDTTPPTHRRTGQQLRPPPPRLLGDAQSEAEHGVKLPARRRRRLLGGAFAVALLALLLLNAFVMASPEGRLSLSAASLGEALRGLSFSPGTVRVFRSGAPRSVANLVKGPVRVGVQIGHLGAAEQPEELAALRYSTGAHAHGVDEVEVNSAVAAALAARLVRRGIEVDLLPATVPPGYRADLVLSIHADANEDPNRSGYKSAHFRPARNPKEALLKVSVDRAMLLATGLPDDDHNVSGNMLHYYAFNQRRFRHAVARSTPALLVELGYLTNRSDLRLLQQTDRLADGLERGVLTYLREVGRLEAAW